MYSRTPHDDVALVCSRRLVKMKHTMSTHGQNWMHYECLWLPLLNHGLLTRRLQCLAIRHHAPEPEYFPLYVGALQLVQRCLVRHDISPYIETKVSMFCSDAQGGLRTNLWMSDQSDGRNAHADYMTGNSRFWDRVIVGRVPVVCAAREVPLLRDECQYARNKVGRPPLTGERSRSLDGRSLHPNKCSKSDLMPRRKMTCFVGLFLLRLGIHLFWTRAFAQEDLYDDSVALLFWKSLMAINEGKEYSFDLWSVTKAN